MKAFLHRCYNPSLGLFLIRLALATVFLAHGIGKFTMMDQTIMFFGSLGLGAFWAYLVSLVEVLGGLMMLVGIGARIAGFALAIVMIFATLLVKIKMGYFASELDIVLLLSALGIAFAGTGKWSWRRHMGNCGCKSCNNGVCHCGSEGVCNCDCKDCSVEKK